MRWTASVFRAEVRTRIIWKISWRCAQTHFSASDDQLTYLTEFASITIWTSATAVAQTDSSIDTLADVQRGKMRKKQRNLTEHAGVIRLALAKVLIGSRLKTNAIRWARIHRLVTRTSMQERKQIDQMSTSPMLCWPLPFIIAEIETFVGNDGSAFDRHDEIDGKQKHWLLFVGMTCKHEHDDVRLHFVKIQSSSSWRGEECDRFAFEEWTFIYLNNKRSDWYEWYSTIDDIMEHSMNRSRSYRWRMCKFRARVRDKDSMRMKDRPDHRC